MSLISSLVRLARWHSPLRWPCGASFGSLVSERVLVLGRWWNWPQPSLDALTASQPSTKPGPALLADVGEKLGAGGLPNMPLIVLTGGENFSDPQDQAIWSAMHAELAELCEQSKHIHVAAGTRCPSRPQAP